MDRRAFLSTAAILPVAGLAAESDLDAGMTKVKVSAEVNDEGCLVLTVGYPSDCISSSHTVTVNQRQPQHTQIVFRPKTPPGLSQLSQVQERGGGRSRSFFWLFSRRSPGA